MHTLEFNLVQFAQHLKAETGRADLEATALQLATEAHDYVPERIPSDLEQAKALILQTLSNAGGRWCNLTRDIRPQFDARPDLLKKMTFAVWHLRNAGEIERGPKGTGMFRLPVMEGNGRALVPLPADAISRTQRAEQIILGAIRRLGRPVHLATDLRRLFSGKDADLPVTFAIWNLVKKGEIERLGRGTYR
jgi:hypothetical protein